MGGVCSFNHAPRTVTNGERLVFGQIDVEVHGRIIVEEEFKLALNVS